MEAHETQVGDLAPFLAMPLDVFRESMGTEYFIRGVPSDHATTTCSPGDGRTARRRPSGGRGPKRGGGGPGGDARGRGGQERFLARIGAMARTIHRFSTWGGAAAWWASTPWPRSGPGSPGPASRFVVGVVLAAVLVAAPLRVIWHGQRISAVYGHPGQIEQALETVPGAARATAALQGVVDQRGRGLRG